MKTEANEAVDCFVENSSIIFLFRYFLKWNSWVFHVFWGFFFFWWEIAWAPRFLIQDQVNGKLFMIWDWNLHNDIVANIEMHLLSENTHTFMGEEVEDIQQTMVLALLYTFSSIYVRFVNQSGIFLCMAGLWQRLIRKFSSITWWAKLINNSPSNTAYSSKPDSNPPFHLPQT